MGNEKQLIKLSHKLFYNPLSLFKYILQNTRLLGEEEKGEKKTLHLLLIVIKGNHKSTGAMQ